ncbi:LysE family transporter [Mammaliicoccus sciuri]|uniref:LysE family transporter n=1 Tax=Mammaliicoccus sciuri TaxID=1296 RepID=UPI0021D2DDF9|nr:LysE family transporter [Mammaliicoccus sciuri]UXV31676.1 LysE family transporter [Mammaliicoccus sciuri]
MLYYLKGNAKKTFNITTEPTIQANISLTSSYKQGFLSTMFNPKAILFYVSILPQFITKQVCSFLFNYIR